MFHRRGLSQRRGLGRAKRADEVRPTRVLSDGFTVVSLRVEKRCRSPLAPLPYSLLLLDPCLCLFMLSFFASSSHPFFCMPFTRAVVLLLLLVHRRRGHLHPVLHRQEFVRDVVLRLRLGQARAVIVVPARHDPATRRLDLRRRRVLVREVLAGLHPAKARLDFRRGLRARRLGLVLRERGFGWRRARIGTSGKHASRRASVEGGDVRDARAGSSFADAPGRRTACARGGDGEGSRSASVSLREDARRSGVRSRARASDGVRKKEEDDPRERRGGRTRRTTS